MENYARLLFVTGEPWVALLVLYTGRPSLHSAIIQTPTAGMEVVRIQDLYRNKCSPGERSGSKSQFGSPSVKRYEWRQAGHQLLMSEQSLLKFGRERPPLGPLACCRPKRGRNRVDKHVRTGKSFFLKGSTGIDKFPTGKGEHERNRC